MSESQENKNESLIAVARKSMVAADRHVDIEGVHCTVDGDGSLKVMPDIGMLIESDKDNPSRRVGTSGHTELDSFIEHINRHKEERTTVWADVLDCKFTAIYNYNAKGDDPGVAGWGDHRATYACPMSPEWEAWRRHSGITMTQQVFADWIDERFEDLVEFKDMPSPIEMVEMSRNLRIYTKGTFAKKIDATTGEYALECKEEHTKESTKIPRSFMTALRIFEGGELYRAEIRLKFRIDDGQSCFSYTVHRATELQREAFHEMRDVIAEKTERPVFAGTAE